MDNKKYMIPEVGRGCAFGYDEQGEITAQMADGCFKLHETPWLAGYPDHEQCDIFEVRFKNTRRSFYQNVNNLDLQIGDIVAVEATPGHDVGKVTMTGRLVLLQLKKKL